MLPLRWDNRQKSFRSLNKQQRDRVPSPAGTAFTPSPKHGETVPMPGTGHETCTCLCETSGKIMMARSYRDHQTDGSRRPIHPLIPHSTGASIGRRAGRADQLASRGIKPAAKQYLRVHLHLEVIFAYVHIWV